MEALPTYLDFFTTSVLFTHSAPGCPLSAQSNSLFQPLMPGRTSHPQRLPPRPTAPESPRNPCPPPICEFHHIQTQLFKLLHAHSIYTCILPVTRSCSRHGNTVAPIILLAGQTVSRYGNATQTNARHHAMIKKNITLVEEISELDVELMKLLARR